MYNKLIGLFVLVFFVLVGHGGYQMYESLQPMSDEEIREIAEREMQQSHREMGYPEQVDNPKDMSKHLDKTRQLISEGADEQALERLQWYYENALAHDPHVTGVRNVYALSAWETLAERYPPAKEALIEARDARAAKIRNGDGNWALFSDVESLNDTLGESGNTVELFAHLHRKQPNLADRVWPHALEPVLNNGRYELARNYLQPSIEFKQTLRQHDQHQKRYENEDVWSGCGSREDFRAFYVDTFVEETLVLIKAVDALGNREKARDMLSTAMERVSDPRFDVMQESFEKGVTDSLSVSLPESDYESPCA